MSNYEKQSLYDKARERGRLWSAWEVVHKNAKQSEASKTREEAEHFRQSLRLNIEKIARSLRTRKFQFKPQRAVAIPKTDGKRRPLVVAPIDNRIVQRSLLETLQETPAIRATLAAGFNFGGVKTNGVPDAVKKVASCAKSHPYFVRTDISGFFQHVRRQEALDALLHGIDEPDFTSIVTAAVTTELDDATKYLADTGIFPLFDEGVAQGSCLSPLLCNVLLHPFDIQMNARNIVTVRYIDDFILLAPTEVAARRAFQSAQAWLTERNLTCYNPFNSEHAKKAEHGLLANGATFLGCEISSKGTRPSRENFLGLKKKVSESISNCLVSIKNPSKAQKDRTTFAETLVWISSTIRGWGNTFGFCTDERLFGDIDRDISELLSSFELEFRQKRSRMNGENARRAIGVFLLNDRKTDSPKDKLKAR